MYNQMQFDIIALSERDVYSFLLFSHNIFPTDSVLTNQAHYYKPLIICVHVPRDEQGCHVIELLHSLDN